MYTDEDGNKVIIEFRENEDGKKVKVRYILKKENCASNDINGND